MSDRNSSSHQDSSGPEIQLHFRKLVAIDGSANVGHASGKNGSNAEESQQSEVASHTEGPTEFIRRAVDETTRVQSSETSALFPGSSGIPPKTSKLLLAILSYCFTKGLYSCHDIEEAILRDPEIRALFGTDVPDDRALRRFRRTHRETIQSILETAFTEAQAQSGQIPQDHLQRCCQPNSRISSSSRAEAADGTASSEIRRAVQDRIQKALFIDGMSKDF